MAPQRVGKVNAYLANATLGVTRTRHGSVKGNMIDHDHTRADRSPL